MKVIVYFLIVVWFIFIYIFLCIFLNKMFFILRNFKKKLFEKYGCFSFFYLLRKKSFKIFGVDYKIFCVEMLVWKEKY